MAANNALDLDKAGSAKSNSDKDLKPLSKSRGQRQREAQNLPQAVIKVSSYASGVKQVKALLKYISREGELSIEDEMGLSWDDWEEVEEIADDWSNQFGRQSRVRNDGQGRDAMHLILSAPIGADRLAVERAIRDFAEEQFSENHHYLFTLHEDTNHPHGHVVVNTRGFDGKYLRTDRSVLQSWREIFAEKCNEHDIAVDASSRLSRGVGTRGRSLKLIKTAETMAAKGVNLMADNQFTKTLKADFKAYQEKGVLELKPWEEKAKAITELEKKAFQQEAKSLKSKAQESPSEAYSAKLEKEAVRLQAHAKALPEPKSRREQALEAMVEKVNGREPKKDRDR